MRLCDVDPQGVSRNLTDQIVRSVPAQVTPGQPREITITLTDVAHVFLPGHRVRLQVAGGAHPRYARNLGEPPDLVRGTRTVPVTHQVLHDALHPAALTLPVVGADLAGPAAATGTGQLTAEVYIGRMTTDQSIQDLLAAGDAAIITAAFQTGDFGPALRPAGAGAGAADRAGDAGGLAQALNSLGMVAHHENLGVLMSGSAPADLDVAAEEQLFRTALAQAQQAGHTAATAQSLFGLGLVFQVLRRDWMTAMPYYWQALGLVTAPDTQAGPTCARRCTGTSASTSAMRTCSRPRRSGTCRYRSTCARVSVTRATCRARWWRSARPSCPRARRPGGGPAGQGR